MISRNTKHALSFSHLKRRILRFLLFLLLFVILIVILTFMGSTHKKGTSSTSIPPSLFKQDNAISTNSQPIDSAISPALQEEVIYETDKNWMLLLINAQNVLPDNFMPKTEQVENGHMVDARIVSDLQDMLDGCRAAGLSPLICSSYRTYEMQAALFNDKITRLIEEGYSPEAAKEKASTVVAMPGTSEHETGLALDLVDQNNQNLDETQEYTPVQQWLFNHSWEYGFILRYPNDKSDITGIIYEPWHYRYVGKEATQAIHETGLCLEEYLEIIQDTDTPE